MNALIRDLTYSLRVLVKDPGFTIVTVMTLALGIGANSAIFSVVNGVLLRPLPYPSPQQLFTLRNQESMSDLDDIAARSQSFDGIGGAVVQSLDLTGGGEPVKVDAALVNRDVLSVLGASAQIGRTFIADEDKYGGERVVVLGNRFWQERFGSDTNILGKPVELSGNAYTVIGVLRPDFAMPRETPDMILSLKVANPVASGARGVHFLRTYLRLKPNVSLAAAQAELGAINTWLAIEYPDENNGRQRLLQPLQARLVGEARTPILVLFSAVGLVLLVACANFSSLLLARAASRQQELAVRSALGASRFRLARQVVTESILLSVMGGFAGLMLALWGVDALVAIKPATLPSVSDVGVDRWVLGFTLGVSLLTGLIFGLVPALSASHVNTNDVLKESGRGLVGSVRHRIRSVLVIAEIAIAVMLLIGAGLLIKGFWRLRNVNPGFRTDHLLTMKLDLPDTRYEEIPTQTQFRKSLLEKLNAMPGISAAMISELPLSGDQLTHNFILDGAPPVAKGAEPDVSVRSVAGDYFKTMGIDLIKGRDLNAEDTANSLPVGVVNESFVREFLGDRDPIGARIKWARGDGAKWITIVGVVRDVKHFGLNLPEESAFYYSYMQLDQPWKRWMYLVVRSQSDSPTLTAEVSKQIWSIDSLIPVARVKTMSDVMSTSLAGDRFNMTLMFIFGLVALLLAAIGIYGVVSYSAANRTHEIGIRVALGAQTQDVLQLILAEGIRLGLVGVALGLVGAYALTRLMQSLLFGVTATDPMTYGAIALILIVVALAACLIPARRAATVDPMVALRHE